MKTFDEFVNDFEQKTTGVTPDELKEGRATWGINWDGAARMATFYAKYVQEEQITLAAKAVCANFWETAGGNGFDEQDVSNMIERALK